MSNKPKVGEVWEVDYFMAGLLLAVVDGLPDLSATGRLKSDPVWLEPSFAYKHKPLAEAFAEVARCMQTPRGIIILNRQWCDEQVANPPRWARDGRGVARGERFEAFKVGLCNFVGAQSEPVDDYQHLASQDPAWTLIDVRQYVDQQCGEAPAWSDRP